MHKSEKESVGTEHPRGIRKLVEIWDIVSDEVGSEICWRWYRASRIKKAEVVAAAILAPLILAVVKVVTDPRLTEYFIYLSNRANGGE